MQRKDDRRDSDEGISELVTHTNLIGGKDSFMSGWGEAKHGVSYAFWACRKEDIDKVWAWVSSRDDQRHPRQVDDTQLPKGTPDSHLHIYCVRDGHPALA